MKRYFTFKDEKSDKFWSVEVNLNSMTAVFGKTGTAGVINAKEFTSESEAQKEAEKLMKEKLKKGYSERLEANIGRFGEVEFWSLIERSKNKSEDISEQIEVLTEILSERSEGDIVEFERVFQKFYASSYQSKLWAAAYIINGGCSDDGFDYFRGRLIAQGKDVFFAALENPESLARAIKSEEVGEEFECEEMLYVAGNAYSNKAGQGSSEFMDLITQHPFPDMEIDWSEEGDDLKNRFPKLWKKFGGD